MRKALSGLPARSFDITKSLMHTLTIEPRIVPDRLENLGIGLMAYFSGASLILGQKISDTNDQLALLLQSVDFRVDFGKLLITL